MEDRSSDHCNSGLGTPLLMEERHSVQLLLRQSQQEHQQEQQQQQQTMSPPRILRRLPHSADDHDDDGLLRAAASDQAAHKHGQQRREEQQQLLVLPWYKHPQQVSALISNFSASYNVVNISLVLPIIRASLLSSSPSAAAQQQTMSENAAAAVASSLLAGMMVGQVLGGALGDVVGTLRALRFVMVLQIVASLGSSSACATSWNVYWQLAAWRFVLGVGAGGVYPLAAVLSASSPGGDGALMEDDDDDDDDDASKDNRPPPPVDNAGEPGESSSALSLYRVVQTFSTQGVGFIAVPLVTVPLLYTVPNLDVVWRIILGLGSVPGIILLLWQWHHLNSGARREHETMASQLQQQQPPVDESADASLPIVDSEFEQQQIFEISNGGDEDETVSDDENESVLDSLAGGADVIRNLRWDDRTPSLVSERDLPVVELRPSWWEAVRREEHLLRKLLGTAATWFLFDVLFYGNTLFQPIVIEAAFGGRRQHSTPLRVLQRTAIDSLVLTSIALPGYAVAGLLLGRRKRWCYCGIEQTPRFVMLQGFAAMAILYLVIGAAWDELRRFPPLLVLLYSLTFFFANYGPNTTTFVLPSLVYSPECRSTFNGLSAAAGKLGALMGASLFEPASRRLGNASVMLICATIAVVGLVLTKLFVPNSLDHRDEAHERATVEHDDVPGEADSTIV